MSVAGTAPGSGHISQPTWSLRIERAESSRLVWALVISIALHLAGLEGYFVGRKIIGQIHWPAWVQQLAKLADVLKKKETPAPQTHPREAPLLFVDVSPAHESAEPPKNAKYYSDRNSVAANPSPTVNTDVPKVEGKQKIVPRTEDVPRAVYTPLQPAPPVAKAEPAKEAQPEIKPTPVAKAEPRKEPQPQIKPRPAPPPGDLAMAKPAPPTPQQDTAEPPRPPRPKTIQEAKMRAAADNRLTGQKSEQEGGVRRHLEISSLDAKATPFGGYDREFIAAVEQRWFALLDQQDYAFGVQGKVVLQFTLYYDGRIADVGMADNTAGFKWGELCREAIEDPAPYAVWPPEMRRLLGNTRNIQITFVYY